MFFVCSFTVSVFVKMFPADLSDLIWFDVVSPETMIWDYHETQSDLDLMGQNQPNTSQVRLVPAGNEWERRALAERLDNICTLLSLISKAST